jgi:hypothetical protein
MRQIAEETPAGLQLPMVFSSRRSVYLAVSILSGAACDVVFDMRGFGFASSQTAGTAVMFAVCCISGVFLFEFVRWIRIDKSAERGFLAFAKGAAWSGLSLIIVVASWIFAAVLLPNSASVYFKLHRSYIESHWQKDQPKVQSTLDTSLSYFPLAFQKIDERGEFVIPSVFYLWDRYYRFMVGPFEQAPHITCGVNDYWLHRIEGQIYVVQQYGNPPGSFPTPCLVEPILNNGHL